MDDTNAGLRAIRSAQIQPGAVYRRQDRRSHAVSALDTPPKKRLAQMPSKLHGAYLRAMSGRSAKAAIQSFCQMCMGWSDVATNIRLCTDPACPLYPYRPYQD